jgi:glycine/D-amino acid oxidase-like deaminating enzyme
MQVAVIGAGFQGACTALELARRGVDVVLFDRAGEPVTRAGFVNEGRIHLGFTYAKDTSLKTARKMLAGGLAFRTGLNRWIDFDGMLPDITSKPCLYAVHRSGQLGFDQVWDYCQKVDGEIARARQHNAMDYLGDAGDLTCRRQEPEEVSDSFDSALIEGVVKTPERSIDVKSIAKALRAALAAEPKITFLAETRILSVTPDGGRLAVAWDKDTLLADHVVNAAWTGRLVLDRTMGLEPAGAVFHRLKFGIWITSQHFAVVQGPYGDLVPFPNGETYMSWYPYCKVAHSDALEPPDWPLMPAQEQKRGIVRRSAAAIAAICPAARFSEQELAAAHVEGGVICAWGEQDIDWPDSLLHQRRDSGVHTHDRNYHSIDTGKYTLAPLYALEAADRICPDP